MVTGMVALGVSNVLIGREQERTKAAWRQAEVVAGEGSPAVAGRAD